MTTKTNEQRRAQTLKRQSIIDKLTMNGRCISYNDMWNELKRRGAVDEITKENFRNRLFSYGVKIKAGCVSRKDAPKPERAIECAVVDRFAPDPWWHFIYKILAKLRGTFQ